MMGMRAGRTLPVGAIASQQATRRTSDGFHISIPGMEERFPAGEGSVHPIVVIWDEMAFIDEAEPASPPIRSR
jgi:hypothetical protein